MKRILWVLLACALAAGCGSQGAQKPQAAAPVNYLEEGKAYLAKGDLTNALRVFQTAVLRNPGDSQAQFILAELEMRFGAYERALEGFKKVIEIDPDNGTAYFLAGGCYDLLKNKEQAIGYVKKSADIFQENRDEKNFKMALAMLRRLTAPAGPAGDAAPDPQ